MGLGTRPHFNLQFYMLDRYPHSAASEQRNQDEAVDVIVERADLGVLDIDMRNVLGYTSRYRLVPKRYIDLGCLILFLGVAFPTQSSSTQTSSSRQKQLLTVIPPVVLQVPQSAALLSGSCWAL